MIRIKVDKRQGSYRAFESTGHAGFAPEGEDIVCAAVSALLITTFNGMEAYTEEEFTVKDSDGYIKAVFEGVNTPEGALLMDTLLLGLEQIKEQYPKYLKVQIREV